MVDDTGQQPPRADAVRAGALSPAQDTLTAILADVAVWQSAHAVPDLTDDEAMEIAVDEIAAMRAEFLRRAS